MSSVAVRALSVVGLILLLVGCARTGPAPSATPSSSPAFKDLTGRQIASRAGTDMKKVTSIHLEGTSKYDGTPARLDLAADKDGTCVGFFEFRRISFEVIHTDERGWFLQANARYWQRYGPPKHRDDAAARFANRWLHVDGAYLGKDLEDVCDLDWIRTQIIPDDVAECVKTVGGPATEEPTVQVWCGHTHVWVRASAPHNAVKYESRDGLEKVDVGDYDQPVEYGLPPDKDVVDLTDSELA